MLWLPGLSSWAGEGRGRREDLVGESGGIGTGDTKEDTHNTELNDVFIGSTAGPSVLLRVNMVPVETQNATTNATTTAAAATGGNIGVGASAARAGPAVVGVELDELDEELYGSGAVAAPAPVVTQKEEVQAPQAPVVLESVQPEPEPMEVVTQPPPTPAVPAAGGDMAVDDDDFDGKMISFALLSC
jgi:hypothetical protein